jgi:DNA polymerase III delta prime subunit
MDELDKLLSQIETDLNQEISDLETDLNLYREFAKQSVVYQAAGIPLPEQLNQALQRLDDLRSQLDQAHQSLGKAEALREKLDEQEYREQLKKEIDQIYE